MNVLMNVQMLNFGFFNSFFYMDIRLRNSPYFVRIQVRTREQSNEAENGKRDT